MAENKTDWKSREVGSLWSKGNYHTGKVTLRNLDLSNVSKDSNVSVVMFKNKEQNEQGTRPEYNIYLVDTDDNNSQSYKKSRHGGPPAHRRHMAAAARSGSGCTAPSTSGSLRHRRLSTLKVSGRPACQREFYRRRRRTPSTRVDAPSTGMLIRYSRAGIPAGIPGEFPGIDDSVREHEYKAGI